MNKCSWSNSSDILKNYHDKEWGKPIHDDHKLFEMLILESMSCGLSWEIVLKKRDHMRKVFDNFDPERIALYTDDKINELILDTGIIRHRAKLLAMVQNAKAYLELTKTQSFDHFLWRYVGYKTICNASDDIITRNEISDKLSADLKKLGFKFVGSVIIYSFMQAVGIINDHDKECPFYHSLFNTNF